MSDIGLRIVLSAVGGSQVSSAISSIASSLGKGGLGGALLGVGLAAGTIAVAIGVKSVQAAGDFQQAMLSNVAHAGLAKDQFDKVSQAVLKMSTDVGRSPTQLAEAMYPILSAFSGIQNQSAKSSLALSTLKMSFQAVAGTTVNGTDVANAAVGTFNALGLATNNAGVNAKRMSGLFDVMDKTVQDGNMQWSTYKNVISKLAVSIQGTGIKFNEASAALATLTNEGKSAQLSQTYLNNLFGNMAIKLDAMAKHAKALKISFNENAYSSMNLADKIKYLNEITGGNQQKMLALLGGSKVALQAFNGLSTGIKAYGDNLNDLNHAQGALKASFDTASQGFNFQMSRIQAGGEALMITIGTQLLPIVTKLASGAVPIISAFTSWIGSSNALGNALHSLGTFLVGMSNNWQEMAASLGGGGISQAFNGLMQSFHSFASLGPLILPFLNNLDNMIIGVAQGFSGVLAPALRIGTQIFNGVRGVIQTVIMSVESQLMPAIVNLAGAIGPVVSAIVSWVANSHILPVVFTTLGVAVRVVVGVLSILINVIAGVINFFTKTEVGVAALRAIFIILGTVIGVIAAVVLPGLIAGFLATAASAIATGVSIALAFLPITLIVLGIIAVVTLIVLAVTHWGQIAHWLQGVWAGAVNGIKSAWSSVVSFFTGIWRGIQQAFGSVGQWFQDKFKQAQSGLKNGWDGVTGFIHGVGQKIGDTFQQAANNVVKAHQWMMDHNYYYHNAVIAIQNWTNQAKAWLSSAWNAIVQFVSSIWQKLSSTASSVWNGIVSHIRSAVQTVVSWLQGIWNSVSSFISGKWNWLSGIASSVWNAIYSVISGIVSKVVANLQSQWNQLGSLAQSAWNAVTSVFSNAWGSISGALSGLWSNIAGWFNNLAGQAVSWGSNIIQGFINGITSMLGKVGNAVSQVAGKVAGFLGFHSPSKEGPGRELMTWGPGLVQGFSQGILNSIPMLQTALGQLMLPVVQSLTSPMTAPIATGFRADPYNKASQLDFTQAPTEIYRSKLAPHETKAQKQKTAQTLAAEWKVVDAELKAIQVRGSAQLKNDRATYAAEIKAIQEHDKHLKGNAKKAGEEEIKMLRAQEKARLANERSTLAAKLKAARAQEKQIKQEIKLELHVHANKVDAAQIDKIAEESVKRFSDQIRAQFGNL